MKSAKETAKKFVRRVRSKSPFRRRKRADTLIAEVRDKEQAFSRQLASHGSSSAAGQTSQPDDQAEIEVVLESSSCVATAAQTESEQSSTIKIPPPSRDDAVPELVPSSSASTDDQPLTNAQAAARRFMERQQRIAAGNRRKSFRDRFMRPAKNNNNTNSTPPPPPSPARTTKQMGIAVRGRTRTTATAAAGRGQGKHVVAKQERGRSKERSVRGSLGRGPRSSSRKSRPSPSPSQNRSSYKLLKEDNDPEQLPHPKKDNGAATQQPFSIEVGNQSRVSELSTPAAIIRQESLGNDSIRGVRQALQKMEMELAAAGDAGKRVSRDKIMNALNYMANALHYDDQKELAKELDAWIDESVIAGERLVYADEEEDDDNSDDASSSDDDDDASGSTFDLEAFEDGRSKASTVARKQRPTQSSFQDLFLRLGKFFTISEEDKTAVRKALDDLLWTELAGNRPGQSTRSSASKLDDDSESSDDDSIGNFDPLTCNLQGHDPKREPSAPTRGRSWWRRHGIGVGGSSVKTKKENLYPVEEGPPSPESKISVPSPTGKVNPRSPATKSKGSGKSSRSGDKSGGSGGKSPGITIPPPPLKSALKERTTVPKSRFAMDETDSGWSSFDETTSDFWRQGDRYTIPSKPKASTQQAQLVSHYKLSYPPAWEDSDPFFETDFLDAPKGDDEFDDWDNCLHPAENVNHRRQLPS